MKKSYLILAAVAGLFASCAQNEDLVQIADEPVAIGFNSEFVDNVTRAEMNMTWFKTAGNAFGVYGFKGVAGETGTTNLFTNEKVTYTAGTTNDWTHPTVRFWDKSASNYNFYAYAPYGAYGAAWNNGTGFTFTGIPIIKEITEENADVVVAKSQNNYSFANCATDHAAAGFDPDNVHPTHATPSGFVPFTFHHVLSKLSFKVKTHEDYSNTAVITVKKIELNFPTDNNVSWAETNKDNYPGTTTYSSAYAAAETTSITYETEVYNDATGQEAIVTPAAIGKTYIVTPKNGTVTGHAFGIKVTYDVQYKKETTPGSGTYENDVLETACVATGNIAATDYNPAQNEAWVITIDINPVKIDFCVNKVEAWDDTHTADVEVN